MATIECECGTRFDIAPTAVRVVCPGCQRRFTVPQMEEPLQLHSQMSATMLQDLPVVTNIEQHYAQSILSVGMSIPAEAVAVAVPGALAAAGSRRVTDSSVPSSRSGRSTRPAGSSFSDTPSSSSVDESSLFAGDMLLDRYEVQRKIGQGGMSSVYEAHDHVRDEAVALKVLLPHLIGKPRMQERFLQEGRISSNFSHPNIARVYDLHQTESQMVLSMELLHGTTLRYDMHRRKQQGQHYRAVEVVHILSQICEALAIVHAANIVHRDLKPENLWLGLDGNVKIMDFGIARDASRGAHTTGPRGSGTPYYIAPEQLTASRTLDHRADQYSLAVIAYELLTGDIPQGAVEPPHVKNPRIPKRLSQTVFRGLDADPSRRFPTIHAFQSALQFDRRMPLVAKAALTSILLAGLGTGGYAFARWGMPLLEPKALPVWAEVKPQIAKEREAIEFSIKDPNTSLASPALEFQLLNDAPAGATIDKDGVIRWTPAETQAPKKHSFKVMALISENGQTRKEEQTVEINVGEVFDPPVFETPNAAKVTEHKELIVEIAATDPNDPPVGLRYELENPPSGMTIDARTGRVRWTPGEDTGGSHLEVPVRVSLASEDGRQIATTRRLLIDVEEAIDSLTFTSSERLSAEVGKPITFRVLSHDPNVPALNTFYRVRGGDRLGLTIDPKSGDITWTPKEDTSDKSFDITVEACRDQAGRIQVVGQQTIKLTVAEYKPEPPPKEEPEARSPSDGLVQTAPATAPVPTNTLPVNSVPAANSGTCPTPGNGQGNHGTGQPQQGGNNPGTCPQSNGKPGQANADKNQLGNVILNVVDTAVRVHQMKEQIKQQPVVNKLPVQPFPPVPPKPQPGKIFLPPNGNTGIAGGLGQIPFQSTGGKNSSNANQNSQRPAPTNQAPSLQSMLKQKVEQEIRSRIRR